MCVRTKSDEVFLANGGQFVPELGNRVLRFLETYVYLPSGERFIVLPWIEKVVHSWYSFVTSEGKRRTKLGILSISRQQGKTALIAGLVLYHLLADGIRSPQCLSCATSVDQASVVYNYIVSSIRNNIQYGDGKLKCLTEVDSQKTIKYLAKNGLYKSASSDSKSKFGKPLDLCIFDELAFHQNDNLWRALKNSTDATGGLKLVISTAGFNRNGVFYRMIQDSRKILSGEVVDTTIQPWIFEVPDNADLDSPDVWRLANPSMGTIGLTEEEFRQEWDKAKRDPCERLDFSRLKFNSWTETQGACWLPLDRWDACKGEFPDLLGAPVHIGIDAGSTTDLTAVSLCFPADGRVYVQSKGFVPKSASEERERQNLTSYSRLAVDGSLEIVEGNCVGIQDDLIPYLEEIISKYNVLSITVDKWQLLQLSQQYMKRGFNVYEMGPFHSKMNAPTQDILRAVLDNTLVHTGNELLRWQVGHCVLDRDPKGYVKPAKATNAQKIDNLVALVMAWSGMSVPVETIDLESGAVQQMDWF